MIGINRKIRSLRKLTEEKAKNKKTNIELKNANKKNRSSEKAACRYSKAKQEAFGCCAGEPSMLMVAGHVVEPPSRCLDLSHLALSGCFSGPVRRA